MANRGKWTCKVAFEYSPPGYRREFHLDHVIVRIPRGASVSDANVKRIAGQKFRAKHARSAQPLHIGRVDVISCGTRRFPLPHKRRR